MWKVIVRETGAFLILCIGVWSALNLMNGCASMATRNATHAISVTGSDLDQAKAYVKSAEVGVANAKAHADAAGQALLGVVSSAHTSALTQIDSAKSDLNTVQESVTKMGQTIATLTAENTRLLHSWGYRFQVIVTRIAILLIILLSIHFVAGAAAILAPPPYSVGCAIAAKIVNPLGWTTWLISAFAKVEAAVVKPKGTADSPIHAVIEAPKPA